MRDVPALRAGPEPSIAELNERYRVPKAIEKCVIAGSVESVIDQLVEMVDLIGPFGTLVSVGHDWDATNRWTKSIQRLATDVQPTVSQHMAALGHRN